MDVDQIIVLSFALFFSYKVSGADKSKPIALDFSISGLEFYHKFVQKSIPLKVRNGCTSWPLYNQIKNDRLDQDIGDIEVESAFVYHTNFGEQKSTFGEFLQMGRNEWGFKYLVSKTDRQLLSAIEVPVMISSCESVLNLFKKSFQVEIMASKTETAVNIYNIKCFENHTFIATLSGKMDVGFVGKDFKKIKLKAGDLLYLPPKTCTNLNVLNTTISVLMTWKQNISNEVNCNEPTLYNENEVHNLQGAVATDFYPEPHTLITGYKMPPIGFGTSRLYEKTYDSVSKALNIGYRLIDTAQLYRSKDEISSEVEVGRAIKDSGIARQDLFIVTKTHPDVEPTKENVLASIGQSLGELQTEYLDLVLIHMPYDENKCKEIEGSESCPLNMWGSWDALMKLKKVGKIRSLGISNVIDAADLSEIIKRTNNQVSVVQNYFDPFHQDGDIRQLCKENSIVYMGYSALGLTWVDKTQGYGMAYNPVLNHPVIKTIGLETDIPPSTVVLRWAMYKQVVVMPCTTNYDHMETNFYSQQMLISNYLMKAMDKLDGSFTEEDTALSKTQFNKKFATSLDILMKEAKEKRERENDFDEEIEKKSDDVISTKDEL